MYVAVPPSAISNAVGDNYTPSLSSSSSVTRAATTDKAFISGLDTCAVPSTTIVSSPSTTESCRGVTVSVTGALLEAVPDGIVNCFDVGDHDAV